MGIMNFFNKKKKKTQDEFDANRFQGRLEGFSWCILETKNPAYDPTKMKEKPSALWVIEAYDFASNEEVDVLNKLIHIVKEKQSATDNSDKDQAWVTYAKGAVEGKSVIYDHKDPSSLLKEEKIKI